MAAGFVSRAALGAILLMADAAHAGPRDPTWNPPARFDHPYHGHLIVHRLPQSEIVRLCRAMHMPGAGMNQHGCSHRDIGWCEVWIIDKTFIRATPQAVLRHEIGHCNGWPANHPD